LVRERSWVQFPSGAPFFPLVSRGLCRHTVDLI
jgi:hypothetical protein